MGGVAGVVWWRRHGLAYHPYGAWSHRQGRARVLWNELHWTRQWPAADLGRHPIRQRAQDGPQRIGVRTCACRAGGLGRPQTPIQRRRTGAEARQSRCQQACATTE